MQFFMHFSLSIVYCVFAVYVTSLRVFLS
jgi:hypothetical protein